MNSKRILIALVCFFTLASAFYSGMMFQRSRSAKLRLEVVGSMSRERSRLEREHQQALKELRKEQQVLADMLEALSDGKGTNRIFEPVPEVGPEVKRHVGETNHPVVETAWSSRRIEHSVSGMNAGDAGSGLFRDLLGENAEVSIDAAETQTGVKVDRGCLERFVMDLETVRAEMPVEISELYQERTQAAFTNMWKQYYVY